MIRVHFLELKATRPSSHYPTSLRPVISLMREHFLTGVWYICGLFHFLSTNATFLPPQR